MEDIMQRIKEMQELCRLQEEKETEEIAEKEYCPPELIGSIPIQDYFDQIKESRLHDSECNIGSFENRYKGSNTPTPLEDYFKHKASQDDSMGANRVFVLLNKDNIPLFFYALRLGILIEELPVSHNRCMPMVATRDTISPMEILEWDRPLQLQYQKDLKYEQDKPIIRIESIVPAVEISYFAKNTCLNGEWKKVKSEGKPLSQIIFQKYVVPQVHLFSKAIGAKYAMLFAAPKNENDVHKQEKAYEKIISVYTQMGFTRDTSLIPVKPRTDLGSIFMCRTLESI